ncbi:MAG: protoglobin domain-containing protein [Deltaproteobacteria bacterium]|nr:protoglobin domain-containing protein [Deltaproteobacteria bacterium]
MDLLPQRRCLELLRYVRFTDRDLGLLRALAGPARPSFVRIADEFYERIREHDEAHAVLRDDAQVQRLKGTLVRWMESLLTSDRDEKYCEDRMRIGRVHVRVGLPQRFVPVAMALIHRSLEKIADENPHADATRSALVRAIDVELAVMLESYVDHFAQRLQHVQALESQALRERLEHETRVRSAALERSRQVIVGIDRDNQIAFVNAATEAAIGFSRDELVAQPFVSQFAHPTAHDELYQALSQARAAGADGVEWTGPMVTRAGHQRLMRWHLVASEESGKSFVLGAADDATDEQTRLAQHLRTERLAGIGTLAAGLAHEIRNPLNGALLHVTYLERSLARRESDPGEREAVGAVSDEIRRLSLLVRDFLVFARPTPPTLEPLEINDLTTRVLSLIQADALAAGVTLKSDLAKEPLQVRGDRNKLQQVFLNLLRNAVEAVSTSLGTVTLRTRRRPRHAVIEVHDDGAGIPSDNAPIFDAFFSTKPNGTGLGLAIVHRIVSDHGGTVEVESSPANTVFRVLLPAAWGSDEAPQREH